MTPYEIGIVLHYFCRGEDHEDMARNPPVWRPTIDQMLCNGVLYINADSSRGTQYALTERGEVYARALQDVPLPVQVWVMPERTTCAESARIQESERTT